MAFKRVNDGSGSDLLKSLESQRIKDILGIQIPESEAKLLSNGRLTCMICIQRPIFDTINILSIHRKGKKHLNELSKYLKRKEELEIRKITGHKKYMQSFDHSKKNITYNERKKKLELPENDESEGSAIVSQYISSMKKTTSFQNVINLKKKCPYQRPISNYNVSIPQDVSVTTQSSSQNIIEIGWIKNSDGSWSKDPQAEFDSDDNW